MTAVETRPGAGLVDALVPRYFRVADATAGGGALAALLGVLGKSVDRLGADIEALYDDLFVETCAPWLLPYFAAQAGVTGPVTSRAWVGLATGLRRRKGTLGALVEAARAVTGFAVAAEVGAESVATTWSAAHSALPSAPNRPNARVSGRPRYPRADGGTVLGDGSFPLPGVTRLSVWRLAAQPVTGRIAAPLPGGPAGRAFTFHPLGVDAPLFGTDSRPVTRAALAAGGPAPFAVRVGGRAVAPQRIRVDPARGRLLLPAPARGPVVVDYAYAAAGDIGGGPYARADEPRDLPHVVTAGADAGGLTAALRHAVPLAGRGCLLRVEDSATYAPDGDAWQVTLPPGARLRIAAAAGRAPAFAGGFDVRLGTGAVLELAGLLVGGPVAVSGDGLLAVEDCTLLPRRTPSLAVTGRRQVAVSVGASVLGPVVATAPLRLAVRDSVVDGNGGDAVGTRAHPVPGVALERVTVLGTTFAGVLVADGCLFGRVVVARPDAGVVRYSAVGEGSVPPALVACVSAGPQGAAFVSTRYGDAAYAQVHDSAPRALRSGGEDGAELGAFARVSASRRLDLLGAVLADFVPAGTALTVRAAT